SRDTGASLGQLAKKYVLVDAGASFGDPVAPPTPFTDIEGGEDALVGTWAELESDGSPCKPELAISKPHLGNHAACPRREIARTPDGVFSGHITWQYDSSDPAPSVSPRGPYAPASDRSKGYPVGVSPDDYALLQAIYSDIRYRILDGAFHQTNLT